MATDVIINFVLDRSGSMQPVQDVTVKGFNAFVEEQQAGEGNAWFSLTLFNSKSEERLVAVPVNDVPPLGSDVNPYSVGGNTALYDAVAQSIQTTDEWLKNGWFTGKVITAILTDGQENSSKTTSLDALNELIADRQALGWEFIFLGSGGASWTEGQRINVDSSFQYDGTALRTTGTYTRLSNSISTSRLTGQSVTSTFTGGKRTMTDGESD